MNEPISNSQRQKPNAKAVMEIFDFFSVPVARGRYEKARPAKTLLEYTQAARAARETR